MKLYNNQGKHIGDINDNVFTEVEIEEPWTPKGGDYWVDGTGNVRNDPSTDSSRLVGAESATPEQAERKRENRITRELIDTFIVEHNGDWEADWNAYSQLKYYPTYNHSTKKWKEIGRNYVENKGSEAASRECIDLLVDKLNRGMIAGIE